MLFTAFSPANKPSLSAPGLLLTSCDMLSTPFPLPSVPFTLFTTAKTAKYIIRPLIPVMLTHPSSPLPPDLFQYCSSSLPLASPLRPAGMAAELLWSARVYPFGLRCGCAWCEVVRGLFLPPPRRTKCQGLPSVKVKSRFSLKVFWRLPSQLRWTSSKSCGNSWRKNCLCFCPICSLYISVTSIATWCWRSVVLKLKKV